VELGQWKKDTAGVQRAAVESRETEDFMSWLGWALLSALFAAATAILAKLGVADVDPNLATAVRTTVVVVFAWAIAIGLGTHGGLVHIERRSWIFLGASGVATGLSWICYFRALSLGQASKVAPIDKLSVVFVILLAAPLLGESLTVRKGLGGLLIAVGAILLAWA
jgi:transporter family protein